MPVAKVKKKDKYVSTLHIIYSHPRGEQKDPPLGEYLKCANWKMPVAPERFLKPKKNDPL